MRYVMVFGCIALSMIISVDAMNARDMFLREIVLFAAATQTDIVQETQPQKSYPQVRREDKKIIVKNYPRAQPRKKYASDKKLCAPRSNKK